MEAYLAAIRPSEAHAAVDFGGIIAVEPDAGNRAELESCLAALAPDIARRIVVQNAVLDAAPGDRLFHSGLGYASQLSETGSDAVTTTTLDALCAAQETAPGFIKLHLEGAEHDALLGGLETIRRHRPIVAATVYHDADGLYRTAQLLMRSLDTYRFLFRLHGWCGTGPWSMRSAGGWPMSVPSIADLTDLAVSILPPAARRSPGVAAPHRTLWHGLPR